MVAHTKKGISQKSMTCRYSQSLRRVSITLLAICSIAFQVTHARGATLAEEVPVAPEPLFVAQSPAEPNSGFAVMEQNAAISFADQMVLQLNQYRATKNLPPFKVNPALTKAAQDYAERMGKGNFFGHYDPDFGCNKPSDRAVAAGYTNWSTIGENLAAGYSTTESAMSGFQTSPGHNAAMLNADFREIGIGYYFDADDAPNVRQDGSCPYVNTGGPYRYYWVQLFGARTINGLPVLPVVINSEAVSTTQRTVDLYIYGGVAGNAWAQQMRLSEDGKTWGAPESYAANKQYTFTPGSGSRTIYVQLLNGNSSQTISDSIELQDNSVGPTPTPVPGAIPRVFIPIVKR